MPVNPDLPGRIYPAAGIYDVGREKIREFAQAVKAENPAHFDVAAAQALGYPDLVAPPTFAIIVAQQESRFDGAIFQTGLITAHRDIRMRPGVEQIIDPFPRRFNFVATHEE